MSSVLQKFLEQENEKSDASIIAKIKASRDLMFLADYTGEHSSHGSAIVRAAGKRIETIHSEIIANIDDMIVLVQLYGEKYYQTSHLIGPKILDRLDVLLAKIMTCNDLKVFKDTCREAHCSIGEEVIQAIYKRMIELVLDKDTVTLERLLGVWLYIFQKSGKSNTKIEQAIGEMMEYETDIKLVVEYYCHLMQYGPIIGGIAARRIDAIITLRMQTCDSIEDIGKYAQHTIGDVARTIVEDRIIEILTPELEKTTLDTIDTYRDMVLDTIRFSSSKVYQKFKERVHILLVEECGKITAADAVYLYIERFGSWYEKEEKARHPALIRFNELVPDYFKDNANRKLALDWWLKTQASNLEKIIIDSINEETDALLLAQSGWPIHFFSIVSQRLKKLVLELKEVTPWFESCLEKKTFMYEEEAFVAKARELAHS